MTDFSGIQTALGAVGQGVYEGLRPDLAAGGATQHTRLLRLHTPLEPDVLLAERATITETLSPGQNGLASRHHAAPGPGLNTGFGIDMLALSTHADLSAPDLLGQPVLLELLTAQDSAPWRPFHGHVTRCELLGADGGYARYRLRIEPWTALLAQRTDAWVFQDQSVLEITEAVFADYVGQGRLMPHWRIDVADRSVFTRRSQCVQFNETDLAFLQRLWVEEGLFTWFEHQGDASDLHHLGSHTLVIADHNGAFRPNTQARIRFTQPGAVMKEDSITRWQGHRRVGVSTLLTASWDYRAVDQHRGSAQAHADHAQPMPLVHADQPGAYAYDTPAQAERRALIQMQALEAGRKRFEGVATVRTLAPATRFMLAEHAEHEVGLQTGDQDEAHFVILGVVHQARNNLRADTLAGGRHRPDDAGDAPLYEAQFTAQRAHIPVRASLRDDSGRWVHAQPTIRGTQTALVVGLDHPLHTDRDGRIKVQYHWQRGTHSSHRLAHPSEAPDGDNAPASDASGTWMRVAQPWAGANWGGVFIPRLGQEVIVGFIEGDMDRPVVLGATYNGQGAAAAPGNTVAAGAARSTGNAPAWFPGADDPGSHEGGAHTAPLSGFKSQSLAPSLSGSAAHNQLVLDDTPGQGRVLAHTTQAQTWLQIGHLLQQHGNQRLARRGHGLELHTQAQGALRAAAGLHLSTHARLGGTGSQQGQIGNTQEAHHQLRHHAELLTALSAQAQTHLASLPHETTPEHLPAHTALQATLTSLQGVQSSGGASIPVTERPDLVLSAAADLSSLTPAHTVLSAGQHTTVTADQDINLLSQRHMAWSVKAGISLFTRGEARDGQRAVPDVGLVLHAASGNVHTQAQDDAFTLTAEQAIDLQSTAADVVIRAPHKIVLNGGGGYIKMEGGHIEIGTRGQASFKASLKELS